MGWQKIAIFTFTSVLAGAFALWITTPDAFAATLYWVGADGANTSVASNWKITNPTGCGGGDAGSAPGLSDTAIFDADCDNGATIDSSWTISNLTMDSGYTGTVTQSAALTPSTFSQSGGTLTGGSANIDVGTGGFTLAGGTFTSTSGTLSDAGNWTHTGGGTFTAHASGTVEFDTSTSSVIDVSTSETFTALTFNGTTVSIATGDTTIATGTLTFTSGAVTGGTIEARGDVTVSSSSAIDSLLSFTSTATQSFSGSNINSIDGDVTVNKSGGQVNQGAAFTAGAINQDVTIQEGTYDVNGNNLTVNGTNGVFTVEDGGNLQLQGGESVTTPTLNSGSTVTYDGTAGPYTVKDWSYQRLTFNGSGGVFNLGANETVTQALTITAGTFDISGFNLTTSSTFSNSDTFRLQGAETLTTFTNDTDSGTVEFDGTGTYSSGLIAGDTYYNLTFSGSGSWTLDAALDVNNNFSQSAGTLDVSTSNYGITVGGNWSRSGGTFTARSGTVTFDGTNQTINNSTTFYNLTKQESSNNGTDSTLTIAASTTQTVTNTLDFDGLDADDRLNLVSGTPGTRYTFDVSSAQTVTWLDVTDSNASSSNITCTNCVNGGNNDDTEASPRWVFGSTNTAPVVSPPRKITQVNDTIEFEADIEDSDGNKTQLLVEYSTTQSNWKKTSIKSVSASQGDVSINNSADYQISSIDTDSGKITLKVVWDAKQQFDSSEEDTVYLRVTPYDGTDTGTVKESESFALDTRAPVISNLYLKARTSTSLTLAWTPEAEKNFDKYVLCYGLNLTDVKNCNKTAKQWTTTQDSKLSTFSTSQTTITGLLNNRTYHVLLKATDDFNHTSTLLAQNLQTTNAPAPPHLTVEDVEGNTITVAWTATTSPGTFTYYQLCYGQDQTRMAGNFCRVTGSPSGAVLRNYTSHTTTSDTLNNLLENTLYYAKIFLQDSRFGRIAGNLVSATTCQIGEKKINGVCTPPAPPPPPPPACSDSLDNDSDGLADFPSDPGCADASDDDETDPVIEPPPPPPLPPPPDQQLPPPPPAGAEAPSEGSQPATNPVADFVEEIIEQIIVIAKKIVEVIKQIAQTAVRVIKVVAQQIPEVATKPAVTVPIAVVTATAVAASTGLVTVVPNFAGELAYLFQRLMQGLVGLAGIRRRRPWGRVVDGHTGTPLPQAIVRILDRQTQQLRDTAVTDAKGDFASLLPAGQYRFEVNKPGWHLEPHPASFLNILSHQQVYDGNFVDVRHEGVVSIIIAMRPEVRVAAEHIVLRVVFQRLERFLTSLSWPLLVFGFGLSTVALAKEPTRLNIGIFIFYIALIAAKLWVASHRHKTVGFVKDTASGLALNQALVQLYNAETGRLMATKVTSPTGQFALVPPPGVYTVVVSHPGYTPYRESHVVVHPGRAKALALTFSLTPELPKTMAVSGLNPA